MEEYIPGYIKYWIKSIYSNVFIACLMHGSGIQILSGLKGRMLFTARTTNYDVHQIRFLKSNDAVLFDTT